MGSLSPESNALAPLSIVISPVASRHQRKKSLLCRMQELPHCASSCI